MVMNRKKFLQNAFTGLFSLGLVAVGVDQEKHQPIVEYVGGSQPVGSICYDGFGNKHIKTGMGSEDWKQVPNDRKFKEDRNNNGSCNT